MKGLVLGFLRALKLPIKLRSELEQKQWKHVRNFAPSRLKNISWQKSLGKDKKKKKPNTNFRKKAVKKVDRRVVSEKTG